MYEKKNANIPIKNLTKIADYFEVSIAELYSHEVNEDQDIYELNSGTLNKPFSIRRINAKKLIVNAPLVTSEKLIDYHEEADNQDFLKNLPHLDFVIENVESGVYLAFEIIGNSMENGTVDSIPNGAIVLGRAISLEDLEIQLCKMN